MDKYIDPLRTYLLKYRESVKGERPEKKSSKRDLNAMNMHAGNSSVSAYQQQKAMKAYTNTGGSQMSLQIPSQMPMTSSSPPLSYQQPGEVPFSTVPPALDQAQMATYAAQETNMTISSSSQYSHSSLNQSSLQHQQYTYDPNTNALQSGVSLNSNNVTMVTVPIRQIAPPQQSFYPPPQNPQPPPIRYQQVPIQQLVQQVQQMIPPIPEKEQHQHHPEQQLQQQQQFQSGPADTSIRKE